MEKTQTDCGQVRMIFEIPTRGLLGYRGDFVVEKFQFDNGAGATVRGYLLLPKPVASMRKLSGTP